MKCVYPLTKPRGFGKELGERLLSYSNDFPSQHDMHTKVKATRFEERGKRKKENVRLDL